LNLFDLLFLAGALATIAALLTALISDAIGRRKPALRILRAWVVAVYFAADLASILFRPVSMLHLN